MMHGQYIQLLRRMIHIPSPTFGEEAVHCLLCSELDTLGITHKSYNHNIIALNKTYSPDKKTLALCAHMDTVEACSGYTRDPFNPGEDDEIVYGLGSNDDGGSVVSLMAAFCHFYEKELPFNLMLILSCEEERSGSGGVALLYGPEGPFCKGELPDPDWMIIGEPTGMKAATSERGLLVIDAEAHGVSGHAARGEGVNALYIALEDITGLRNFKFERISPIMGEVRLSVTQIQAGSAHNVIPDSCSFVVDIRPNELYTNEEILEMLQKECKSTLKARNLRNRSSVTAEHSPLLSTAKALGIECFSSPTTSDWIRIQCDGIKMGPGDSSRSHKADEYILVSEIHDAIEKYIEFIDKFYGNTLE